MKKRDLYISTIADDAEALARDCGLGLELAEFCTAYFMDEQYDEVKDQVERERRAADRFTFHMPFNELYPSAIDPKAVLLARERLDQAFALSKSFGIRKMIVHSGYVPLIYYKSWFEERSVLFWKDFLRDKPEDVLFCLENVMEDEPELLLRVVRGVDDPRFKLCLDVGHANCQSELPPIEWLRTDGAWIAHFHIHNNDGSRDQHASLFEGTADFSAFLREAAVLCPDATYAIETMHAGPSVDWLLKQGLLNE